ncbi:hypothetical protein H7J51_25850 [Mycobacterium crocinum]|uniref:Uncharacterized protein n=1 Tax=Mycolicibacterium crocinum TaxID=388459 RepID=A0ABY3TIF9_9MYCO|nr:hypothetical protein [Mycolicibacterium crocinum]MCV7218688.1 hypothetical protein [Mycolicibacterium crocinum]ULN39169.1 hypothetical protein MI149_15410 [Mycolicibacterium crocinum]
MSTATEEPDTTAEDLNYEDYTHDFMGKVGNIGDFSRDFLAGLARVFEDVLNFMPYAHVKIYSEKVGINAAMDVAAEVSRAGMRQVMPMGRFIAPPGWDWKDAQYQAIPFDVQTEDLTKPALIRLIKTYWDQYLKGHNYFIDQWTKIIPEEEVWLGLPDMYQLIIDYQYPKLAKVFKIEPVHVVDFLKLAVLSIDGTLGYGGEYIVYNPDHVVLNMRRCEVLQKYTDEGLYPPARAWMNCTFEQRISAPFFPGCKLSINLPPKDFKFAKGEPFCVWTYTRGEENHAAAAAAPDPRATAMKRIPLMDVTVSE